MKEKVAILVDGDFFIRRHFKHFGKMHDEISPTQMATNIHNHCLKHLDKDRDMLYRIFFYDCKPLTKKVHYPISRKALDLSKTPLCIYRLQLHKELISKPCLALRYGYLDEKNAFWQLKDSKKLQKLAIKEISIDDLSDDDFMYYAKQKGVDMKIGIDISTLAINKLVDKIVLISGDSDFVSAAKLARTHGLHFTLDPMGNPIREDLQEHIDYLKTTLPSLK